jgi:regulator of replication initiation timing
VDYVQGNSLQGNLNELMEDVRALRAELRSLRQMLQVSPVAELLSKRQAARILGIGRDTLRRLIDYASS